MNRRRIVIIGATSAIAEQCARHWIKDPATDMVLVGRDPGRLDRIAADLRVRSPQSAVDVVTTDFLGADAIETTVTRIVASRPVDIALIAHGNLPEQSDSQQHLASCKAALEVNGISPVLFAEAFAAHMAKTNHGKIAVIGSVAGDRGRKSNYVYGAAKGLVSRYVEGMQHRFAGTPIGVTLIKPGPTDTPMTAHLKEKGLKLASVEHVALDIVRGIESGAPVIYTPIKWRLIMLIIRLLPRFIFQKLDI